MRATGPFEISLNAAQALFEKIEAGLDEKAAAVGIKELLQSEALARGFFVTLLTNDFKASNDPPPYLIECLRTAPDLVLSLLAKNLVMSSATGLSHERNGDSVNAEGSKKVAARSTKLIALIGGEQIKQKLEAMLAALNGDSTEFTPFVERMKYDKDQANIACKAISATLSSVVD